jgi:NAD(P)-dependent dehydrogenase (short-subunit alcohol dehydrogenase family)
MLGIFFFLALGLLVPKSSSFSTAAPPPLVRPSSTNDVLDTKAFAETATKKYTLSTKDVVNTVVVTGATGQTGRYVVEELLQRDVENVIAIVRDMKKATEVFPNPPANLQIKECDLCDVTQITNIMVNSNTDAAIWCATGFSSSSAGVSFLEKMKRLFGLAFASKQSIDLVALPAIAKSFQSIKNTKNASDGRDPLPKVVMCSSAGATRTAWSEETKEKFKGAADIPIVRLNPFNILDRKRESEELLRSVAVESMSAANPLHYCVVRPCGLNDAWPAGSRSIFTQGDVAVGRLNRKDLAKILVDCLSTPEATDKTFEVVGIAGYPQEDPGMSPDMTTRGLAHS